jgi:hypothetical protein
MRKSLVLFALAFAAASAGFLSSAAPSSAAFHLMRVYGVMAGATGSANVQYVELRMTDGGQNFVTGHHICFFDASGVPYARFEFMTPNPANGADEASILVATAEFDAAWTDTPDKIFSDGSLPPPNNVSNMTAIAGGADLLHPIRHPSGKVAFGTDLATVPGSMCAGSFAVIDSIAYGTGYTGGVDFVPKFNTDLPISGTSAARLQGLICIPGSFSSPCPSPRDNSIDYALTDVNSAGNNPRNNSGVSGPVSVPDADADGVGDAVDNCPNWPNPAQTLPAWSVPAGDTDCDGFPNTTTVAPRGRENFIGTDATDPCADDTILNNERGPTFGEPLSPWPPDVNDNRSANLSDVVAFGPVFNTSPPNPAYNARFDLNASNSVNLSDVVGMGAFFNKSCTG